MVLHLLLHIFCCLFIAATAEDELRPECPTFCGNVSIPYPFGIGNPSCYRNEHFEITCNYTETHDQKPFWAEQEILDISLLGQMTIRSLLSWDCYFENNTMSSSTPYWINLDERGPFTFSSTRNKLRVVGCDSRVILTASGGHNFTSACSSYCEDMASVNNDSCAGFGCCQLSIPVGVKRIGVKLGSFFNDSKVRHFNPCSYSFLVDQDKFEFSVSDLYGDKLKSKILPARAVIDWMAGDETCEEAQANKATYACRSENSHCNDSSNGPGYGYRCNCYSGYEGNPYIQGGCQGVGSLLFIFIGATWIYWAWKKIKMIKLKEQFFQQNGGLLLQQKISSRRAESFKIFTTKELERATENYNVSTQDSWPRRL